MCIRDSNSNDVDRAKAHQINANDHALISRLLDIMQTGKADFTLTFHYLSQILDDSENLTALNSLFENSEDLGTWLDKWKLRRADESSTPDQQQDLMNGVNPVYIPRNHQVESAIRAAEDHNDFSKFDELHEVLQNPYHLQENRDEYLLPPKPEEVIHQTFCGT